MRPIEFRVYCEFEIEGKLHKVMESEASWFLLTQRGELCSHGPCRPLNTNLKNEYKKLIPLFLTGLKDSKRTKEYPNGQKIWEGDIVKVLFGEQELIYACEWYDEIGAWVFRGNGEWLMFEDVFETSEVIGNIHENPELLEDK